MRKYPTSFAGTAYIDEAEIVAIEPASASNVNLSRVHLRGGGVLVVTESPDAAYQRATKPATAQAAAPATNPAATPITF